jgi:hypothetical protein
MDLGGAGSSQGGEDPQDQKLIKIKRKHISSGSWSELYPTHRIVHSNLSPQIENHSNKMVIKQKLFD